MADRKINTGLTENEIHTAFSRALNDMTDAQVQALISAESQSRLLADSQLGTSLSQISGALSAEKTARQSADTAIQSDAAKLRNALIAQINGGAKNRCPTQSGSSAGQSEARWFDISGLNVSAGDYVFSFTSMTSTDTDGSRCRGVFYDENGGRASEYFYIPRGDHVNVNVTLTATAKSCRINSGETLAESTGDTLSFSGAMLCSAADWDFSQTFVPYCPTMPELYQMILSQNGGC